MERIAVCCEKGLISTYLSGLRQFMFYEIEDMCIVGQQLVTLPVPASQAAVWLAEQQVDKLMCASLNRTQQQSLQEVGIGIVPGMLGMPEMAIFALLSGQLSYDAQATDQLPAAAKRRKYTAGRDE